MALTFGFYNSYNHDRMYDALQMSSIFDGIIEDGVYQSIGQRFVVKAVSGNDIAVGTGRAWFDHTWTLNDALLPLSCPQAEVALNRYDAVVLEVNHQEGTRANAIKVLRGSPASNAQRPTLTKTDLVKQYPLAYIYRPANSTYIRAADIQLTVGTSACPYVAGVLKSFNLDDQLKRWEDQWNIFFDGAEKNDDDFREKQNAKFQNLFESQAGSFDNAQQAREVEFNNWFNKIQELLEGNAAANLANSITDLESKLYELWEMVFSGNFTAPLADNTGAALTTSEGVVLVADWRHIEA